VLGRPKPFQLALQEIIPLFIPYTFSNTHAVRDERASHILFQSCEVIEEPVVT
jgi:hypothetical protein